MFSVPASPPTHGSGSQFQTPSHTAPAKIGSSECDTTQTCPPNIMSTVPSSDAASAVYIRKQKTLSAPVVQTNDVSEVSFGVGVGMHSPTMQRSSKSFVPRPTISNSESGTLRLSASNSSTRRVSFELQSGLRVQSANEQPKIPLDAPSFGNGASNANVAFNTADDWEAPRDHSAFLAMFSSAPQREIDTCIQFATHGGPMVKHSSRAHRTPVLCTFRLTKDCTRLVWAEASKPSDEKYGLETSSIMRVIVGAEAAIEFERSKSGSNSKTVALKMILLLEGDEKLRLEALDKVSLLYWSFAFHFIAEPQNRVKLHSAASRFFLTESTANAKSVNQTLQADHGLQANGGQATAHSATCSEAEPSTVRAFFSKARHDRLDAVTQMLDSRMVPVDAVDEHGNTVLIVAAQNNNKRICKAVLRRGANILHQNETGQTCLHFAFSLGYTALGEYLISKGGSENLRNKYGLTCRQGLAPSNSLRNQGAAVRSPVHGYITQRGENVLHQQHYSQPTFRKLLLPTEHNSSDSHVDMHSGSPGKGFATDRPSPSAQRMRLYHGASSCDIASNSHSCENTSRSPADNIDRTACNYLVTSNDETCAKSQSNENTARTPELKLPDGSRINVREEKRDQEVQNPDVQSHNEIHDNLRAGVFDDSAKVAPSAAAAPTPDRLSMVMLRASAALAASDALSKELLDVRSPSAADSTHFISTSITIKPPASPTPSRLFAKQIRSPAVNVSEDSASDSSEGKSAAVFRELHANIRIESPKLVIATAPAKEDFSSGLLFKSNTPVKSAPIVLLRRGSSNSSSSSINGERQIYNDDSVISGHDTAHVDSWFEQSVGKAQRLKLRSGIGEIRPTSAGSGARRSVRPDLASGLGFKTIHRTSVTVSDDRMPLRPSTPVLARHASTEEDLPLRRVALPLSRPFAFDAAKIRMPGVNIDQQQQSPLSTARVGWGSPAK